jgi:hypothetical protein
MATVTGFDLNTTTAGVDGTTSYTEGGAARRLAQNASVTATGNFAGQTLTISGLLAEDELGFANGVSIVGNAIQIGGTTIGTFSGGTGGSDFVVTFNSNASASQVQRLLRNITYKDLSDDPAPNRTLAIDLAGTIRADVVTVTAVNDRPAVDLDSSTAGNNALASFVEQTTVAIAPSAVITDPDAASFVSLTATLRSRPDGDSAESLSLNAAAQAAAGGLTVSYDAATGTLSISGAASAAAYQTILTGIAYSNTSDNPSTANRRVDVVISDGTVSSALRTVTIGVARTNDAPVLDLNGGAPGDTASLAYGTGDPLTAIAPAGTIVDADSANFNGGSLRVAFAGGTGAAEDRLGVITDATVTLTGAGASTVRVGGTAIGTLSGGAGGTDLVVALNNAATPARVQTLLEHIGYSNSSSTPSGSTRTVTFTVADGDGGLEAGSATATIVLETNDPPALTGDLSAAVAEGGTYAITTSDLNFADPDDNAADVTFAVTSQANGTVLVNGVAAASFTGQQLADGLVSFKHDGSETTAAAFDVSVEDGNEDGSAPVASTFNFTVTALNDAPVLTGDLSATVGEGGTYAITTSDLNFADADDGAADVTFTVTSQANGTVLVNGVAAASFTGQQLADGLISFAHDGSETTAAAFDVTVEDGNEDGSAPTAQTFTFAVTALNDAPTATPVDLGAIAEEGTRLITAAELLGGVTDPDGPAATITSLTLQGSGGTLVDNGNDTWTYTGATNDDTSVTFAYTASDGSLSASSTATLDLTPVNDGMTLERISVTNAGAQGNGASGALGSGFPIIFGENRYVAFYSEASNLVPGDNNAKGDFFVHDRVLDIVERVVAGINGPSDGAILTASADGRYLAFNSLSPSLVGGDGNGTSDIFVYDRQTQTYERIGGNGYSSGAHISDDGRFVAFHSHANNLVAGDTNNAPDCFIYDRDTGTIERALGPGGSQNNTGAIPTDISADGRYTVFYADSAFVAGDTNGGSDAFVYDRVLDTVERVSVASGGVQANAGSEFASITPDGRFVAFTSTSSNLVANDTNGQRDVFVHDRLTGTTERVSVTSNGTQLNGGSQLPTISDDGRYVAFHGLATNGVSDTNGTDDAFVFDRQTDTLVRLSSTSTGAAGNAQSAMATISADGQYVTFASFASNLVAGDTNGFQDVFLAHLSASGWVLV